MYYSDYLKLDKILQAQQRESEIQGKPAHDEMLFIIIHQAYELWFKQLDFELNSVIDIIGKPAIDDNHDDLQTAVHRVKRMATILNVLVHQMDVMETMTSMDFLDFRDMLRPASGFQSIQFKLFEARLGLPFSSRHGKEYYLSQLKPEDVQRVKDGENKPTLLQVLNRWLERFPVFDQPELWKNYTALFPEQTGDNPFWTDYQQIYAQSLQQAESDNVKLLTQLVYDAERPADSQLSLRANRTALFIMLYRGYPLLHLPYELLHTLLDIDELLATWRWRHLNMVQRIIGVRIGTGGSTGQNYLRGAMSSHYVFQELARLSTFLIERQRLPKLSPELEKQLGFRF